MTNSLTRRAIGAGGVVVLMAIAAACSGGGGDKVTVGTQSTSAPSTSAASSATSSTKPSTKRSTSSSVARVKGSAKQRATATTASPSTVTVPITQLGGDTTPQTEDPTAAPTTTAPRTTTTIEGPQPYDPTKPINLGGEPGVTPAEQARAEKLVRDTLRDLPKYADPNVAYAAGYRSIGDAATGDEHYVKWAYVNDGHILDSQRPESLVYEMRNGKKTLVAAMYMLPFGSTFADVPDVGGPLTQWHVHNDLCLADNPSDPLQKVVSSLTTVNGECPAGTTKAGATPMIHVWIVANVCGPFASLEGIGAGQVPPGQTRHCDRAHG